MGMTFLFFFNDTATTEIYTLSLHDALPIHTTAAHLEALPPDADASPCHGRAGLAETLLYASHVLGDPRHAVRAVRAWREPLRRFAEPAEWPCGVASGWNNPSLMLGHAGIGYALLRADDPVASPPLLLVESVAS